MRLVTHLIAVNREIRLRRQLADIERVVLALPVRAHADLQQLVRREMEQAAACDFPTSTAPRRKSATAPTDTARISAWARPAPTTR